MRRSASACPYKNGLSVEPGWRSEVTKSTSGAALRGPLLLTQASTSPLALSSTSRAASSTCRPLNSRSWVCMACWAKRWRGALKELRMVADAAPSPAVVRASWRATCGAMPSLAAKSRRARAEATNSSMASQPPLFGSAALFALGGSRVLNTLQARWVTCASLALGARIRAAATAASRWSRPCGALPKRLRLKASMPTSSPRKGTRLR